MPPFESCGAVAAAWAHSHCRPPAKCGQRHGLTGHTSSSGPNLHCGPCLGDAAATTCRGHPQGNPLRIHRICKWTGSDLISSNLCMLDPLCGPLLVGSERSGWLYCPRYDHLPITEYFLKSLIAVSNLAQFMHCGKLVIIAAASYNHSWCRLLEP